MKKQMAWSSAVLFLLSGCSSAPSLPPIRHGGPVEIVMADSAPKHKAFNIHNETFSSNTGTGTTSGVLAGGLLGFTCGPLAILCVPLGALAGAITGTATGAVIGLTGALSSEKAGLLRDRLSRVQQSHGLLAELQTNITERAKKYWTLNPDASATVVGIALQEMQLSSTRDEQISILIRVQVDVLQKGQVRSESTPKKMYEYSGPPSSLSIWLDEGNDFIDTSLTSASQQIAAQIVADLAAK